MANKRERESRCGEGEGCLPFALLILIPDASLMDLDLHKRYHKCQTPEEPINACNPCT